MVPNRNDRGQIVLELGKYGSLRGSLDALQFSYRPKKRSAVQGAILFLAQVTLKTVEVMGFFVFLGLYLLGLMELGDSDYGYVVYFGAGFIGLGVAYSAYKLRAILRDKARYHG